MDVSSLMKQPMLWRSGEGCKRKYNACQPMPAGRDASKQ